MSDRTQRNAWFSCANENNPEAAMVVRRNREMIEYLLEMQVVPEEDLRAYCARRRASLGLSTQAAKQMLNVSVLLKRMPELARLAKDMGHLDLGRLSSIERQVSAVSDEHVAEVERQLVEKLTPRVQDQSLPQRRTLANYARAIVAAVDPAAVVAKRDHKTQKATVRVDDDGNHVLSATLNPLEGTKIYAALHKRAGKKVTPESLCQALIDLLNEQVTTRVTLHVFSNSDEPGVVHLLGAGPLAGEQAQAVLDAVTDVAELKQGEPAAGYQPPASMVAFVKARDGSCRFPGCTVTARNCQLDHVIPYSQGGLTVTSNYQCLCQAHHTLKTEGLAHVDMDENAVCTWTLNDGSVHRTEPNGPLAQSPARTPAAQAASVRGHTIGDDIARRQARGAGVAPAPGTQPDAQPEVSDTKKVG